MQHQKSRRISRSDPREPASSCPAGFSPRPLTADRPTDSGLYPEQSLGYSEGSGTEIRAIKSRWITKQLRQKQSFIIVTIF